MSHFTVWVIGDNVADQLQPFHEFECTGVDDQYVVDVDHTNEVRALMAKGETLIDAIENHMDRDRIVDDESKIDREGRHRYSFAVVRGDELVKVVRRTNPNKKWDWWVVGGRWTGALRLKHGAVGVLGKAPLAFNEEERTYLAERRAVGVDSARFGDVDFEAMREAQRAKANAAFDTWEKIFTEHGRPRTWTEVRDSAASIESARVECREQPAIKAMHKVDVWAECDDFGFDRDAYVTREGRKAAVPFAILADGTWYERGSMGWFGCVSDEKDTWLDQAESILGNIDPNATITCVDCHI